jgi:hypothetical protein
MLHLYLFLTDIARIPDKTFAEARTLQLQAYNDKLKLLPPSTSNHVL